VPRASGAPGGPAGRGPCQTVRPSRLAGSARIRPGEGDRWWSCLGVPAGVPGPAPAGAGPVRRIKPRPSRRARSGLRRRGPRAQAVCGGPSLDLVRRAVRRPRCGMV